MQPGPGNQFQLPPGVWAVSPGLLPVKYGHPFFLGFKQNNQLGWQFLGGLFGPGFLEGVVLGAGAQGPGAGAGP